MRGSAGGGKIRPQKGLSKGSGSRVATEDILQQSCEARPRKCQKKTKKAPRIIVALKREKAGKFREEEGTKAG